MSLLSSGRRTKATAPTKPTEPAEPAAAGSEARVGAARVGAGRPAEEPSVPAPVGVLRVLGVAIRLMGRLGRSGARPPVVAVDRDLRLVVREVRAEARDVVSIRMGRPAGSFDALPTWQPGAHLDVVLPSGRVRQYSLCGDPADRSSYRIAVRRLADGGGGSREVHELRPGAELTVRGPRSAFPLVRAPRYLFVAGGIGITPILPMVRAVAETAADWRLVYAGRERDLMPFLGELTALDPARVTLWSDAEHGRPPTGAELLAEAPGVGTVVYLCGPGPMLSGVRAALDSDSDRAGVGARAVTALHVERFASAPVLGGQPFVIEMARSGTRCAVPADRTALQVLRERLPGVSYSCQQGFCGTCRVRVLAGEVDHRDRVLTAAERGDSMTICVSRATGDRLVLDL
jgi:ferredoxin-NADP reductase